MTVCILVMSIGNQEFDIPRKYQYQIGIWYLCLKFIGIFLVFYRNLEYDLVKSWFNIGIFRQNKNWFGVFCFCDCHFIGIGLVSACHFPENGIPTVYERPKSNNLSSKPKVPRSPQVAQLKTEKRLHRD